MADVNYFTCTLGQASLLPKSHEYRNINGFIDQQASRVPELPAVGFSVPLAAENNAWTRHVLSFSDIHRGSRVVAELLSSQGSLQPKETVALLCPSTAEFLFLWLALMRLGHPVLLLAPQCAPSAIAHLCQTCDVGHLFHDDMHNDLATEAYMEPSKTERRQLHLHSVQILLSANIYEVVRQEGTRDVSARDTSSHDVAYLHHTSGTASGTPKPIPQTHTAGIGVLPNLDGKDKATFTTTPLYHGGIADLFRAWTSDAMIWLFPGKGVPITPKNIIQCLQQAQESHESRTTPPVKYFSSVPYVLQMMSADAAGMRTVQSMEIVGVGGAALPAEVGDQLVQEDVNLISRFGSAECGFLMSSHRDYTHDKEWQYLRKEDNISSIKFEQQDDSLLELIVLPGWPHMAKKNRGDDSYATADLFEPHPTIKNAWRYHSRADSQLVLITGKKFDPAPLEAAIATSKYLKDVLIFGNGKPYPGALLFRSEEAKFTSDQDLVEALKPVVAIINLESQSHVRLARNMLVPMPHSAETLKKSSKGTILRKKAEERYAGDIEQAYNSGILNDAEQVEDEDITSTIKKIIASVIGREEELDVHTDLFSYGVDSVACIQIRHALRQLLPENLRYLPLTAVEDCGSICNLAKLIISTRKGQAHAEVDQEQLMLDLVKKYSDFSDATTTNDRKSSPSTTSSTKKPSREVVLLTGATGALGAHILSLYLKDPKTAHIYLLVRGASHMAATERVYKALSSRKLTLPCERPELTVICASLSAPDLGLEPSMYTHLTSTITVIHHVAWTVNFRLSLSSFEVTNIAGLRHLLDIALAAPDTPPRFIFCSSVASIAKTTGTVPESVSIKTSHAGPLGYSRSKWVAEAICHAAHNQTRLRGRVSVMRVGQLSGDTKTGIWNMSEAYPMMLSQVSLTGMLPDLADVLSWLSVDIAARAFVEVAERMTERGANGREMQVYHVVSTDQSVRWHDLLRWVKGFMPDLHVVEPQQFIERLEALQNQGKDHPAMRLIPHWKVAYKRENEATDADEQKPDLRFAMAETYSAAPVLQEVRPVDKEYFGKVWKRIREQDAVRE